MFRVFGTGERWGTGCVRGAVGNEGQGTVDAILFRSDSAGTEGLGRETASGRILRAGRPGARINR